ncbi:hypothetical protein GE061_005740 [Apolygus lucorum]|uniref:Uncharacterized protein n=1 Tax=Apolygus lucorum TaxID=248454 RepID=A0A6A4J1A8_APOLU|nr:hypothetical protein GE061_005740 [Apolygus lucorum]
MTSWEHRIVQCSDDHRGVTLRLASRHPFYFLSAWLPGVKVVTVVMVNDAGAEMQAAAKERVGGSTSPLCHGSASSSQEEERLIGIDRTGYVPRRRAMDRLEDDPLTKSKLKGFYCITVLLGLYTAVYFTYLIMRPK